MVHIHGKAGATNRRSRCQIQGGEEIVGDALREFARMSAVAGTTSNASMEGTAICSMAESMLGWAFSPLLAAEHIGNNLFAGERGKRQGANKLCAP